MPCWPAARLARCAGTPLRLPGVPCWYSPSSCFLIKENSLMILPWLILIPFIGGLLCWQCERFGNTLPRWIALLTMGLVFGLGLWLGATGDCSRAPAPGAAPQWAAEVQVPWIERLGISIHMALD